MPTELTISLPNHVIQTLAIAEITEARFRPSPCRSDPGALSSALHDGHVRAAVRAGQPRRRASLPYGRLDARVGGGLVGEPVETSCRVGVGSSGTAARRRPGA